MTAYAFNFAKRVEDSALERVRRDPSSMSEAQKFLFKARQDMGFPSPLVDGEVPRPSAVVVKAIAINWRGGIWRESDQVLNKLKLSRSFVSLTLVRLLCKEWHIWNSFMLDTRTRK